jgi:hypothetical protein
VDNQDEGLDFTKGGFTHGGTFSWKLAALSTDQPGTNFDFIKLNSGPLKLDGTSTLELSFLNGTTPDATQKFWKSTEIWEIIGLTDPNQNMDRLTFAKVENDSYKGVGVFTADVDGETSDVLLRFTPVAPNPEPATLVLLGTGVLGLLGYLRLGRAGRTNPL